MKKLPKLCTVCWAVDDGKRVLAYGEKGNSGQYNYKNVEPLILSRSCQIINLEDQMINANPGDMHIYLDLIWKVNNDPEFVRRYLDRCPTLVDYLFEEHC